MKNSKAVLAIIAGILIAGGVIAWLMLGGEKPTNVKLKNGVTAQIKTSLKDSVLSREKDGRKLWEFTVNEVVNDHQKNTAFFNGIKGKVYRTDGSYIDVVADRGSAVINKNDFALEGNVKAVLNTGGELTADKITYDQGKGIIKGYGKIKLVKAPWTATADEAETTSAFTNVKLKGHAKVVKGGE